MGDLLDSPVEPENDAIHCSYLIHQIHFVPVGIGQLHSTRQSLLVFAIRFSNFAIQLSVSVSPCLRFPASQLRGQAFVCSFFEVQRIADGHRVETGTACLPNES